MNRALDAIGRAVEYAAFRLWLWRQHPADLGTCTEMSVHCLNCTKTYDCNLATWPLYWRLHDAGLWNMGTGWGLFCMLQKKYRYIEWRSGAIEKQ